MPSTDHQDAHSKDELSNFHLWHQVSFWFSFSLEVKALLMGPFCGEQNFTRYTAYSHPSCVTLVTVL
jgi:hypothetical protein